MYLYPVCKKKYICVLNFALMQEMIMIFLNDFSVLPQTEMFYKVKKNVMFVPNFTVSPIRPQLDRYGPLDNLVS